jgi:hypothetical protein
MKAFLIGVVIILASCTANSNKKVVKIAPYPVHKLPSDQKIKINQPVSAMVDTLNVDQQADAYADYYIVVADTGLNYYSLKEKMMTLKQASGLPIDTLGRYYNKAKNLIALPDNDADEIYAGDYFPRRYPSANLSLEYMDFYRPGSGKKTIGLIAGIYENKTSADSLLRLISSQKDAFDFKAKVYVGCMH